jgi:hypothetical protein
VPHLDASFGIEAGGRLVEEDDGRIPDEAHRDVQAAPHAARVRRDLPVGGVSQLKPLEQIIRDLTRVLEMPQPRDQHEVLAPAEDFVDGRELSGEADRLADVRRLSRYIVAVDARSPCVGVEQRREDFHDGCLARPVRAEESEDRPACHVKVHTAQHVDVLV